MAVTVLVPGPAGSAAPPTHLQIRQALELSRMAADNELHDLSLKAVTESLQHGPPRDAIRTEAPLVFRSARIDTSLASRITDVDPVAEIHDTVRALCDRWQEDGYAPDAVFETLAAIVAPDNAATVFLYARPSAVAELQPNRIPSVSSLAESLVAHADKSGRLTGLRDRLHNAPAPQTAERTLLLAMVAQRSGDAKALAGSLRLTATSLAAGATLATAQITAATALDAFRCGLADQQAASLLQRSAMLINRLYAAAAPDRTSPARAYLLAAARALFATRRQQEAVHALTDYLAVEVPSHYSNSSHNGYGRQRQKTVARELYRRGLIEDARRLLKGYATEFEQRYTEGTLVAGTTVAAAPTQTTAGQSDENSDDTSPHVLSNLGKLFIPENRENTYATTWILQHHSNRSGSKMLLALANFASVAHPAVSPDGSALAFAATTSDQTAASQSRLYILNLRNSELRDLGSGTLPSWSVGSGRLTFSRYTPERGVWTVRRDGSDLQLLDEQGWASRWSPDGRMIAYSKTIDGRPAIIAYDLIEELFFPVRLPENDSRPFTASSLQWGPGGNRLSFLRTDQSAHGETTQIASVPVMGDSQWRVHFTGRAGQAVSDFDWSYRGDRLAFVGSTAAEPSSQVFTLDAPNEADPELLSAVEGRRNFGVSWSRDGDLFYLSRP